jgi:hypothetical protein
MELRILMRPFANDVTTRADDQALVIETLTYALLRLTPLILILSAMGMAAIALRMGDRAEPVVGLAKDIVIGALGSLVPATGRNLMQKRTMPLPPNGPSFSRFDTAGMIRRDLP